MKIYHASGFSIMNVAGREKELVKLIKPYRRLYSFHFIMTEGDKLRANWKSLIQLNRRAKKNV